MVTRRKDAAPKGKPNTSAKVDQARLLRRALEWVVKEDTFADVSLHGNISWKPCELVVLAVLSAWVDADQLTTAFGKAAKLSRELFGVLALHTYQGMMRALVSYGFPLVASMWSRLQALMEQVSPEHYRIGLWLPLAVDGSRFTTPRTASNEQAFAAKNFGQGKEARSRVKWKNKKKRSKKLCAPVKPQIWLTLIWHMGLKLPWCWKTGPSTSSERHHFMDLLRTQEFPENTLFCADAGFIGHELWSTILQQGHSFLIRVGGNVRLLRNLGRFQTGKDLVCLWPHHVAKRKQAPIVLRLIEIRSQRGSMFLVTNVLCERSLRCASIGRLYKLRWGIELQFRTVKQTFGRGKLRSRNSQHALAELDWSLIALAMIQLLAIREQLEVNIPPENTSVAQAIRAMRHAVATWNESVKRAESLSAALRNATRDQYRRRKSKAARYRPGYKDKPSATTPIIRDATRKQRAAYAALRNAA